LLITEQENQIRINKNSKKKEEKKCNGPRRRVPRDLHQGLKNKGREIFI